MTTEAEWAAFAAGVLCGLFISLLIIMQVRIVQSPSCNCANAKSLGTLGG